MANGADLETAMRESAEVMKKATGKTVITHVLSAQLARTGIQSSIRPVTHTFVKKAIGSKVSAKLSLAISNKPIHGAAAVNHIDRLLRGTVVSGLIMTSVISSIELYKYGRGTISKRQVGKNIIKHGAAVTTGIMGSASGAYVGAAVGTFLFPGVGTAIGSGIGGIIGSFAGIAGEKTASVIMTDGFSIPDDNDVVHTAIKHAIIQISDQYPRMVTEDDHIKLFCQFKLEFIQPLTDKMAKTGFEQDKCTEIAVEYLAGPFDLMIMIKYGKR